jgi:uncharacterized membrane protein YhaH (DUF805 family)
MISLAWDTRGRIGRRAYKDATGLMSWLNVIGIVAVALVIFNFTRSHVYLTGIVSAVVIAALAYLQYRYAQLSIKRLHDRGLSGILYVPLMLFGAVALYYAGYVVVKILYAGGLWSLLYNLPGLMEPYVQVFFWKGIGIWAVLLLLVYNIFISWSLSARGQPGDNRYGPSTGD